MFDAANVASRNGNFQAGDLQDGHNNVQEHDPLFMRRAQPSGQRQLPVFASFTKVDQSTMTSLEEFTKTYAYSGGVYPHGARIRLTPCSSGCYPVRLQGAREPV